jgi:hypothetical protein
MHSVSVTKVTDETYRMNVFVKNSEGKRILESYFVRVDSKTTRILNSNPVLTLRHPVISEKQATDLLAEVSEAS